MFSCALAALGSACFSLRAFPFQTNTNLTNSVDKIRKRMPTSTPRQRNYVTETVISTKTTRGELTIRNAEEVRRLMSGALDAGAGLVLDVTDIQACDTAGLQLICSLRKSAAERGQRFRISGASAAVEECAAALGLSMAELNGPREGNRDDRV
jgi:anti-anti-sigma factor